MIKNAARGFLFGSAEEEENIKFVDKDGKEILWYTYYAHTSHLTLIKQTKIN